MEIYLYLCDATERRESTDNFFWVPFFFHHFLIERESLHLYLFGVWPHLDLNLWQLKVDGHTVASYYHRTNVGGKKEGKKVVGLFSCFSLSLSDLSQFASLVNDGCFNQ